MLKSIHFRILCGIMAALLAWDPAVWAAGSITISINESYVKLTGVTNISVTAGTTNTAFSLQGPKPVTSVTEGGWIEQSPGCIQLAQKIQAGTIPGTVKCIKPVNAGTCVPGANGVQICTANLKPSPITGIVSTCNDVLAQTGFKVPSSCTPYQTCIQKGKKCVKKDANGQCQSWDVTYDCGKNVVYTPPNPGGGGVSCPSAIDCSDGSCITQTKETNTGFGKSVSALHTAQTLQSDGKCDPITGVCTVFPGKSMFCKNYEFIGQVRNNCCAAPIPNPDLSNYIKLVIQMNSVDNAIMMLNAGGASTGIIGAWAGVHNAVGSSWTSLGNTATGAWNNVTSTLSTAYDSIVGNTASTLATTTVKQGAGTAAKIAAKQGVIGQMEQALMKKTAEWTFKVFGQGVTDSLFAQTGVGGAAGTASTTGSAITAGANGTATTANIGLTQTASTVLGGVMLAYAIYQIAIVLVSLIFKCTKDQFSFLSNQKLKVCHTIGTGCGHSICLLHLSGSFIGLGKCLLSKCVRWDTKGCCFNSPLSRIIQEQVRPQLGKSWIASQGTDSNGYYFFNPSCGGVTTRELQRVNWSKVDLSEWVAILQSTGNMPVNGTQTMDSLTGAGSKFDVGAQSTTFGTRLNAKQRIENRIGNQNINKLRQSVGKGIWGQIP